MARIRTIKPSFWAHETLSAAPAPVHMLAAALLNVCDDAGYFLAHPELVKASTMPLRRDLDAAAALEALAVVAYIRLGTLPDGRRVGQVITFREHQRVDRPTPSKLERLAIRWDDGDGAEADPAPRGLDTPPSGASRGLDELSTSAPRGLTETSAGTPRGLSEDSSQEGNGREGNKEEERNGPPARGVREAVLDSPGPRADQVAPVKRRPLMAGGGGSLAFAMSHGGHEAGFCGWQCLPVELVTEFATGRASARGRGMFSSNDVESCRLEVLEWARGVRADFEAAGRVPAARTMFEFWRRQWTAAHADRSGSDRRSPGHGDAVGGLRDALAEVQS